MEDTVNPDLAKKRSEDYEPKKPRAYISALCQVALGLIVGALPGFSLIAPLLFFHTSFTLKDMPFVLYQGFWVSLIMVGVLWLICYFLPARRTVAFSMLPTLALSLVLFYFVSSFLNYITQPVTMPGAASPTQMLPEQTATDSHTKLSLTLLSMHKSVQSHADYIIVHVRLKNDSSYKQLLGPSDFAVQNSATNYSNTSITLNSNKNSLFSLDSMNPRDIKPGEVIEGDIFFIVSPDKQVDELVWEPDPTHVGYAWKLAFN